MSIDVVVFSQNCDQKTRKLNVIYTIIRSNEKKIYFFINVKMTFKNKIFLN